MPIFKPPVRASRTDRLLNWLGGQVKGAAGGFDADYRMPTRSSLQTGQVGRDFLSMLDPRNPANLAALLPAGRTNMTRFELGLKNDAGKLRKGAGNPFAPLKPGQNPVAARMPSRELTPAQRFMLEQELMRNSRALRGGNIPNVPRPGIRNQPLNQGRGYHPFDAYMRLMNAVKRHPGR